jgi:ADP-heptose:LPS heptosyltransferase
LRPVHGFAARSRSSRAAACWTACTSTNWNERWRAIAKVLIVRLDGIGDALVCTPLLAALRDAGHAVGMALSDRNRDIFAPGMLFARHVLDRIPWPKHGSTPESTRIARARIAAADYDVALIASEEPEAYRLAAGIPQRVGFTTGLAKPLKSLWARTKLTRAVRRGASVRSGRAHEAEVMFGLANGLGLHSESVPTRDPARLRPLILADVQPPGRDVVVQLGRKWLTIGLDPATAETIVAALAARGAQLVLSAAEAPDAARLSAGAPFIVCADVTKWKRVIGGARIVVTPDTGAAHLAGMLGIPVVDCFPTADAPAQIARWHPWAAPYMALTAGELRGGAGVARIESAVDAL